MNQPTARPPHDHALWLINNVEQGVTGMCTLPDGRVRDLPGPVAVGILTVRSNLAIASALVAVAEAQRSKE
jgi:putative hemolysin